MIRRTRALGTLGFGGALSLVIGGGLASAGDENVDQQIVDQMMAVVPDDPDTLDDAQAGQVVDQLVAIAGGLAVGSGDGSSKLTGPCGGFAFSYDGDGDLIDAAFDLGNEQPPQDLLNGGQAFTSGNPFKVDTDGRVTYFGFAPQAPPGPVDHTWSLKVGGVKVGSGGDPNTNAKNRNAGVIEMDEELPFALTAKFPASGKLEAPEFPTCEGSGHVEINGNGLLDIPGLVGMGLALIGLLGLLFSAPPARTWKG